MSKSVFKLVFSNGSVQTVHCSFHDLDSIVIDLLKSCYILNPRISHVSVYKVLRKNHYSFVFRSYVDGLKMCNVL